MVPALRSTLSDLGIDLDAQANVHLDIEQRPQKTPRAFCAPIEVPDKVMLVIQPIGGADDWRAFFHEAGHTEHYANTAADLEMEYRRLGDSAVTEGWAMLFQHWTDEPAWLNGRLDFPRPEWFASREAGSLLRELWALGQRPSADELLEDVAGTRVELEAVADRIREHLR